MVEHFAFSKFQLSPNHATGFDFVYINAVPSHNWTSDNETWILNDMNSHHGENHNSTMKISHCRGRERFICEIDMKKGLVFHFTHFAQVSFIFMMPVKNATLQYFQPNH